MRKIIVSTALGLGVFAGGAAVTAAWAQGAGTTTTAPAGSTKPAKVDRTDHLKTVLDPLVKDGTITEAQRDKVIGALEAAGPKGDHGGFEGRGGPGAKFGSPLKEAAAIIGIDEATLRTELDGKSLAQVAEAHGKTRQQMVDGLIAAANKRLDQAVTDNKLTKDQADKLKAELAVRIADQVDRVRTKGEHPFGGPGLRGPGTRGHGPRDGADAPPPEAATTPTTQKP